MGKRKGLNVPWRPGTWERDHLITMTTNTYKYRPYASKRMVTRLREQLEPSRWLYNRLPAKLNATREDGQTLKPMDTQVHRAETATPRSRPSGYRGESFRHEVGSPVREGGVVH